MRWLCLLVFLAAPVLVAGQGSRQSTFTFELNMAATTSAGVFTPNETLVRTLWSGVKYKAGSHAATWDNLDGEGHLVTADDYHIKYRPMDQQPQPGVWKHRNCPGSWQKVRPQAGNQRRQRGPGVG